MVIRVERILASIRDNPADVRFPLLVRVCEHYFGEPRQRGTSHVVFSMPWPGDPRVNIQNIGGKAKPYQVRQVLAAIQKMEEMET